MRADLGFDRRHLPALPAEVGWDRTAPVAFGRGSEDNEAYEQYLPDPVGQRSEGEEARSQKIPLEDGHQARQRDPDRGPMTELFADV